MGHLVISTKFHDYWGYPGVYYTWYHYVSILMFHTVSINLYIHISTLRTPYTRTKAYLAILLLSKTKFSIVLNSLPPVPQRRCCHMASHGYMLTCIVRSTLYMLYALTSNLRKAALHIRTINLRRPEGNVLSRVLNLEKF